MEDWQVILIGLNETEIVSLSWAAWDQVSHIGAARPSELPMTAVACKSQSTRCPNCQASLPSRPASFVPTAGPFPA